MDAHAVAVAADVDDVTVVQQAIDQRRGHHLIAQHLAPLIELLFEVSTVEACSWRALISWENSTAPPHPPDSPGGSRSRRPPEAPDESAPAGGGPVVQRPAPGPAIRSTLPACHSRLGVPTRRPQQDDTHAPSKEPEFVQAIDLVTLDARLEGEVEVGQGLVRG